MTIQQYEITQVTMEAEEALLGSILIQYQYHESSNAISEVARIIQPGDFTYPVSYKAIPQEIEEELRKVRLEPQRSRIYRAMLNLKQPHEINVANELSNLGILYPGDCSYMAHIKGNTPCSIDYLDIAKAVKDYSLKRRIKQAADSGDYQTLAKLTVVGARKGFEI